MSIPTADEERAMTYITSVERIGIEKGLAQGRQEGRQEGRRAGLLAVLTVALERMFGPKGGALAEELSQQADDAALERVAAGLRTATTVEELRALTWRADA